MIWVPVASKKNQYKSSYFISLFYNPFCLFPGLNERNQGFLMWSQIIGPHCIYFSPLLKLTIEYDTSFLLPITCATRELV